MCRVCITRVLCPVVRSLLGSPNWETSPHSRTGSRRFVIVRSGWGLRAHGKAPLQRLRRGFGLALSRDAAGVIRRGSPSTIYYGSIRITSFAEASTYHSLPSGPTVMPMMLWAGVWRRSSSVPSTLYAMISPVP